MDTVPKPPTDMFYVIGFDDGENLHPVAAYRTTGGPPELAADTDWFVTQRAENAVYALSMMRRHIDDGTLRRWIEGV